MNNQLIGPGKVSGITGHMEERNQHRTNFVRVAWMAEKFNKITK